MPRRQTAIRSTLSAVAVLLVAAATALGAVRIGTDGPDTLAGTHGSDQLTGGGGDDLVQGLAGNDVYYFADQWGTDTLVDRPRYRVGGKRLPGGSDTLSFAGVTGALVNVYHIPQWGPSWNEARGSTGGLNLARAAIENARLGTRGGGIVTGAGTNTLAAGVGSLGGRDALADVGGWTDAPDRPPLPASDDLYKDVARREGTVTVADWGGTDLLDLRPFAADEVYVTRVDLDRTPETRESLQITSGPDAAVFVLGHFGDHGENASYGQRGRIEKLVFAEGTISAEQVAAASAARGELATAAERLAIREREELRRHPIAQTGRGGAGAPRGGDRAAPSSDRLAESGTAGRTDEGKRDRRPSADRGDGGGATGREDDATKHRTPSLPLAAVKGAARADQGRGR